MIEKIKQMITENECNAVVDALDVLFFDAKAEKFEIAIKKIITYLWEDEKKDYESCESKEEHIFDSLKIVANYMGMEIENAKD